MASCARAGGGGFPHARTVRPGYRAPPAIRARRPPVTRPARAAPPARAAGC